MQLTSKSVPKRRTNVKVAASFFNVRRLAKALDGLREFNSLAVAVSGGGDSMALLLMLRQHLTGDQKLVAFTVNHQLRSSAAAEAAQVKRWCKALGVAHRTLNWRHDVIASGIQVKARNARYNLMVLACAKHKIEVLLTAHTLEDQAETVAMRKSRTSSPKSLAAIWPVSKRGELTVVRPLLTFTRAELRVFLVAQNQAWLEDPSNQDLRFERVRLRSLGVEAKLANIARASQKTMLVATTQAKVWVAENTQQDLGGMVQFTPNTLQQLPEQAQDEALLHLIAMVGGKAPERAKRVDMLNWLQDPISTRRSFAGTIFAKQKHQVLVGREPSRITPVATALSPVKKLQWDNRFFAKGPKGSTIVAKHAVKELKRIKTLPAFVDAGLPVIMLGGKILATPFESHHPKAKLSLATK